jgi:uncharacterized membrane protein
MVDEPTTGELDSLHTGTGITIRRISPMSDAADVDFLNIVAELEGVPVSELPSLYDEVDHAVENLFKTPPSSNAQMEICFSYAGYRVTIDQQGLVKVLKIPDARPG